MPGYLTPGVYFESADQADQPVASLRTDIAAFIGIAQRGPLHQPVAATTFAQFQSAFGSYLSNGYLAYAAQAFFQNGGQKMYAVRVAAQKAETTTVGPQPAGGAASVVASLAGFAAGALVTARQTAVANTIGAQPGDRQSSVVNTVTGFPQGSRVRLSQAGPPAVQTWNIVHAVNAATQQIYWEQGLDAAVDLSTMIDLEAPHQADCLLQAVDPSTNTLQWAAPLGPAFDVTQTIAFETGSRAAHGQFYDAASNPTIAIAASSPGAWGDGVAVRVAHSNLAATATSTQPQPAAGTASYVQSVVGFPVYSLVKVYQSNAPLPIVGYRVVSGLDATVNLLQWNTPLAPQFDVTKPISLETVEFSLKVYVNRKPAEDFAGLSLVPGHALYVEKAVNDQTSQYIRARDLHSPAALPFSLPDPGALQLVEGSLLLTGGRDGIAALRPIDFTGDPASQQKLGLRSLEDVDEVSIVAAPDILIEPVPPVMYAPQTPAAPDPCLPGVTQTPAAPPPLPPPVETAPVFSLDDVFLVQQAIVQHCETMQFRFAILDPPDFSYPRQHVDLGEVQSWRQRFDTKYAALYYPWILVRDPLQLGNQVVRRVPPSGHVAGVYAATDLAVGVHQAPANVALTWAQGLTTELTAVMQGLLNPMGIDCIRPFQGRGLRVYGARTLSSDTSWRFVNVRRLLSMIEHALLFSMQWAVFEPNNVFLQHSLRASISSFLEAVWKQGALAGNTADEAFFIICDSTNNPPAAAANGQLIVDIGVAPTEPAEFVVFRIGNAADALEVSE